MRAIFLGFILLAGCVVSSSTAPEDSSNCTLSQSVQNSKGLLPGQTCKANADCKWGKCSNAAAVLTGDTSLSVCVHDCSCGPGSNCSEDDSVANGQAFTCSRAVGRIQCGFQCKSDDDCKAFNPDLPFCVSSYSGYVSVGTHVCVRKKPAS